MCWNHVNKSINEWHCCLQFNLSDYLQNLQMWNNYDYNLKSPTKL